MSTTVMMERIAEASPLFKAQHCRRLVTDHWQQKRRGDLSAGCRAHNGTDQDAEGFRVVHGEP